MATTFQKVANNAIGTLDTTISVSDTSVVLGSGEGALFPSSGSFHVSIGTEILICTSRSSDTLTVSRAAESTTAAIHTAGAYVSLNIISKHISDLNTAVNAVETILATSGGLRGNLSDETGSGGAVFATSPTLASPVLNTGVSGSAVLDEDDMASNSATKIATQQSIKAYVDAVATASDLDFQGDSGGALSIDLDSETLDIAGGTGIDTVGGTNTLTVNIDSTVTTLAGTQTLTNKTLTAPVMTAPVLGTPASGVLTNATGYTGDTALVTTGVLNSGSINTSFGVINNGASAITTTGLVSAGSLTVTGTTTLNGNLILGDAAADTLVIAATIQGATPLIFEGATGGENTNETSFAITDPSADRTITFPDATLTVNAAANISGTTLASNVVTSSLTAVGTIATGVWEGTDVGVGHGGTGASTATAGFDALSPMTAEGDVLYGGSSGTVTKLAKGSDADVLTLASGVPSWATPTVGDITSIVAGTGLTGSSLTSGDATVNVIGGDGITANANDVAITPAQTTITSIYATDLIIGEDAQTAIDFGTPDEIDFKINNTAELTLDASSLYPIADAGLDLGTATLGFNDLHLGSAGILNFDNANMTITHSDTVLTVAGGTFATAALTATTFAPTDDITLAADKSLNLPEGANIDFTDVIANDGMGDHDAQGVIFTFNAGSTVTPFSPVYLAEDNLVEEANATAIATMPCIGVSINTSNVDAGSAVKVLVMGLIRDDDFAFGTHGAAVYVSTTVGTMTSTAPSGTNNVVQVIGHSIEDDAIFVQPCLTTIEHA